MNAPREFVELPRGMRERIRDAIEGLIALLDEIDGDADFEAEPDEEESGDLEPSLGSYGGVNQASWGGVGGYTDDAEGPDDNGIADGDALAEFYSEAAGRPEFSHYPGPRVE